MRLTLVGMTKHVAFGLIHDSARNKLSRTFHVIRPPVLPACATILFYKLLLATVWPSYRAKRATVFSSEVQMPSVASASSSIVSSMS